MKFAPNSVYKKPSEDISVLFRIISRRSWDELQSWHKALPGSRVEHVMKGTGIFVLIVSPGGTRELSR
jgi:hypothetical protein